MLDSTHGSPLFLFWSQRHCNMIVPPFYRGRPKKKFKDLIYEIQFDALIKHLRPGMLTSLRDPCSSSSSATAFGNEALPLSQSPRTTHRGLSARLDAGVLTQEASSDEATSQPPACTVNVRKRTRHLAVASTSPFAKGSSVQVSNAAKALKVLEA